MVFPITPDQRGFPRIVNNKIDLGAVQADAQLDSLRAPAIVAAGAGSNPRVNVFNTDGSLRMAFLAYYSGFTGGVRVATGDINGDGVDDIITAPGPGGAPNVRVFNGLSGSLMASFMAYGTGFRGGVYVAAGNFDSDPELEIVTGAGAGGGPLVRTWNIADGTGSAIVSFNAFGVDFRGGITVAASNVDGTPGDEIIAGAGPGGAPAVRFFTAAGTQQSSFLAFGAGFRGGVFVAAGDVNDDGRAVLIVGAGAGGRPRVNITTAARTRCSPASSPTTPPLPAACGWAPCRISATTGN